MTPIETEKKNLEMHVELQAMRDTAILAEIEDLHSKITDLTESVKELKQLVDDLKDGRNNQLIKWGSAIIVTLISAIGLILLKVVFPMIIGKVAGP